MARRKQLKELMENVGLEVVGQRIRRIRTERDLSIRDLAEAAEVSKNTLLRIEKGESVHLSSVIQVCKALKLSPDEVAGTKFEQSGVLAVHKESRNVWFNMNTWQSLQDPALLPEEHNLPGVTPFCILWSRPSDGIFNPNLIELTNATPLRSHRGYEFVMVLEGIASVEVGGQCYRLQKHESICFWAAELHRYLPEENAPVAKILSIVMDPFPEPPAVVPENS